MLSEDAAQIELAGKGSPQSPGYLFQNFDATNITPKFEKFVDSDQRPEKADEGDMTDRQNTDTATKANVVHPTYQRNKPQ